MMVIRSRYSEACDHNIHLAQTRQPIFLSFFLYLFEIKQRK